MHASFEAKCMGVARRGHAVTCEHQAVLVHCILARAAYNSVGGIVGVGWWVGEGICRTSVPPLAACTALTPASNAFVQSVLLSPFAP